MLTQAIKRWMTKLFGWWPWKNEPEPEYAPVASTLNKGVAQESASWSSSDSSTPQSNVSPMIIGQGETSLSTIDEWPERVIQPSSQSLPTDTLESPPDQTLSLADTHIPTSSQEISPARDTISLPDTPPPTPEQQLEFLHYLVRRGIVNEGFAEGQVPEQYRI